MLQKFLLGLTVALITATTLTKALALQQCSTPQECEEEARVYLRDTYEREVSQKCRDMVTADWDYNTDLNNSDKEKNSTEANIAFSKYVYEAWEGKIRHFEYSQFQDPLLKRQLQFLNQTGTAALQGADLNKFNEILANMSRVYGTAKICPYKKQQCNLATEGLNLEPDIEELLATSTDSAELAYVWKAWRDASGKPIREMYKEFIQLSNKAAKANGLTDTSDMWLARYEDDNFKTQVRQVWETVKELYEDVYGYVRFKLREVYPNDFPKPDDPIPAHLLGNMWAQSWESLYPHVIPHPNEPGFDVSDQLKEKFESTEDGVRELFQEANDFFTGLGLADMSMSFGNKSMIVRPGGGRQVVCHASAWDFCDGEDFRIKMCTNVNQEDYATVHHELGHIQYFLMYKDQPYTFRDGANPGFHEAVGDVISLSVATPKHMARLKYLNSTELNKATVENFLMQKALEKIAFLPFGFLIDAYRWRLFSGEIPENKTQLEWVKLRNEIQGVIPPVLRTEEDFDAGAKYHVPGNTPYIRYFVSFIIQFQIHKSLCIAAGEYDPNDPAKPLYNCDIHENTAAGRILRTLLEKGFSDNWQDTLEAATGSRVMDGTAIKDYFKPLTDFLKQQQTEHKYPTKWNTTAYLGRYSEHPPPADDSESYEITTGMIIVGIVQGAAIVLAAGAYVVKTFIMKK